MNKWAYLGGFILANAIFIYLFAGTIPLLLNLLAWAFALRYTVFRKYFKKKA